MTIKRVMTFYTYKNPRTDIFLVFTQSQETQKTIDVAAMLMFQTKEKIKIILLRVH